MATKAMVKEEVRWHRSLDGKARVCGARKRTCPLQHFYTPGDAEDARQRVTSSAPSQSLLAFSASLGVDEDGGPPMASLREVALQARARGATGEEATIVGALEIPLPDGAKIALRRETFDLSPEEGAFPRYYVFYRGPQGEVFEDTVELTNSLSANLLTRRISDAFTRAADDLDHEEDVFRLRDLEEEAFSRITELEVLTSGAAEVRERYGYSIFSGSVPGVHLLQGEYTTSVADARLFAEALAVQAQEDDEPMEVALHLTARLPEAGGAKWSLDRIPEGDWYLTIDTPAGPVTEELKTVEQMQKVLSTTLRDAHGVEEGKISEYSSYIKDWLFQGEDAAMAYMKTMQKRFPEAPLFS